MENESNNPERNKTLTSQLAIFSAKVSIVLFLLLGFGSIAAVLTGNFITHYAARVINKVEGTSPENVKNYQLKIRRIGEKYQPVLQEIMSVWISAKENTNIKEKQTGTMDEN